MSRSTHPSPAPRRRLGLLIGASALLGIPFIALMYVDSYARVEPKLGPWPFFFWYQMAWVVMTAVMTYLAFLLVEAAGPWKRTADRSEQSALPDEAAAKGADNA